MLLAESDGFKERDPYDSEWHYRRAPRIEVVIEGEKNPLKERIHTIMFPLRERFYGVILGLGRHLRCCPWSASLMHEIIKKHLPDSKIHTGFGIPIKRTDIPFHFWTEVDGTIFVDALQGFNRGFSHPDSAKIMIGDTHSLTQYFRLFDPQKNISDQSHEFHQHEDLIKPLLQLPGTAPIDWPEYKDYENEIVFTRKMAQELCVSGK